MIREKGRRSRGREREREREREMKDTENEQLGWWKFLKSLSPRRDEATH